MSTTGIKHYSGWNAKILLAFIWVGQEKNSPTGSFDRLPRMAGFQAPIEPSEGPRALLLAFEQNRPGLARIFHESSLL